jgi:hypothetical protein
LFSLSKTWLVRDPRKQNISRSSLEDSKFCHVCKCWIMWNAAVSELWAVRCQSTVVLYSVHDNSSGQHNYCVQYTNSQHRSFRSFRKSIALFRCSQASLACPSGNSNTHVDEDDYGALLE